MREVFRGKCKIWLLWCLKRRWRWMRVLSWAKLTLQHRWRAR
uniref:Uncharacterized protein n=1 Tax=Arundo donax TaxID=35708 RepID=A0A0A9BNI4_ARUDO